MMQMMQIALAHFVKFAPCVSKMNDKILFTVYFLFYT